MGHSHCGTRTKKAIKDIITLIACNFNDTFQQFLWFRGLKDILIVWEKKQQLFFGTIRCPNIFSQPNGFRSQSNLSIAKKFFYSRSIVSVFPKPDITLGYFLVHSFLVIYPATAFRRNVPHTCRRNYRIILTWNSMACLNIGRY